MPDIVTIAERPDLAPVVAGWLLGAFGHADSPPLDIATARVAARISPVGPEQCFVLLHGGVPLGTATLQHHDLDLRPDLTPWLAGVYIEPAFRGRGFAAALVGRVVEAARAASVITLWLYTRSAEGLYRRLGWLASETLQRHGRPVTVMRLDL
jgi:GNAT superfamily N-acetyltransferase